MAPEKSVTVKLSKVETVKAAKAKINDQLDIPPYQQILLLNGEELKDHLTLSDYDWLTKFPVLHLIKSTYTDSSKYNWY